MATDLSKRGFLKLFGSLAGGAMALSVLPDLGIAKELVGSTVLWTPARQPVVPVKNFQELDHLYVTVTRPGSEEPIMRYGLNARGGIRWQGRPGEGIYLNHGELTELVVMTHTYNRVKQDTCQTVVSSAGRIETAWWKGEDG